jgi:hypothetical protein
MSPQLFRRVLGDDMDIAPVDITGQYVWTMSGAFTVMHRAVRKHSRDEVIVSQDVDWADTGTEWLCAP